MKKILLSILLVIPFFFIAQDLDFNAVSSGTGHAPGVMFTKVDPMTSSLIPGYEIPKGEGKNVMFNTSIWCSGVDAGGVLRVAAMKYGINGFDFFPGPISSTQDYSSTDYMNAYGTTANSNSSKWYVTNSDIQNHIVNFGQTGYIMPNSISNWPGNGISNAGVSANLAPFVDNNNNGIYEPVLGDYPDIRGDACYYMIMNDLANAHSGSGGFPLGIEIHTMLYQFADSNYLDSTTFAHFRIYNRGNIDLTDFRFGLWTDWELGNGSDDFVGCDTSNNVMFAYNGDNNDEGVNSYGFNPPSSGIVALNQPMKYFTYFDGAIASSINTPANYQQLLSGYWPNGSPWLYGDDGFSGTIPTNYVFQGNPIISSDWTMLSQGNIAPDDMKALMVMPEISLPVGSSVCHDFAVLYSRGSGQDAIGNANELINLAATAKSDFDAMTNYNCNQVTLGQKELRVDQIELYPNPTSGSFTLSFGDEAISGQVIVTDMRGRVILEEKISNENVKFLTLDTQSGIYNVSIKTEFNTIHKKLNITE